MSNKKKIPTLGSELKYYRKLLDGFRIEMTPQLQDKIRELYPNDIAIENYMRTYILKSLEDEE